MSALGAMGENAEGVVSPCDTRAFFVSESSATRRSAAPLHSAVPIMNDTHLFPSRYERSEVGFS